MNINVMIRPLVDVNTSNENNITIFLQFKDIIMSPMLLKSVLMNILG